MSLREITNGRILITTRPMLLPLAAEFLSIAVPTAMAKMRKEPRNVLP